MGRHLILIGLLLLCSGCFSAGDSELEQHVKSLIETKNIITMDNLGQSVVNIETDEPFDLSEEERLELAREIARRAFEIDEDRESILVAFTKSSGSIEMIAFPWDNENGEPVLLEQ